MTLSGAVSAQTEKPARFLWTPESNCVVMEKHSSGALPKCDSYFEEGQQIRVIEFNDLTIAVVLFDDGDYYGADVFVSNKGERRRDVTPGNALMGGWRNAERTGKIELFEQVAVEQIAKKLTKRAKWSNFFDRLSSGMATTTARVETTSNDRILDNRGNSATITGNSNSTVTMPDGQARAAAETRARERSNNALDSSALLIQGALKANTLFTGKMTRGNIYFKRNKKIKTGVFSMWIDGVNYDFMFNNQ